MGGGISLKVAILDSLPADDHQGSPGSFVAEEMGKTGIDSEVIFVNELHILPCFSCEGCTKVTPGKCVAKDDTERFLKPMAESDFIIGITEIRFGGYSSAFKKAADKFALLATPYYYVRKGKLIHRKRYDRIKGFAVIGLAKELSSEAEENFGLIVKRNAVNLSIDRQRAFVMNKEEFESNSIAEIVDFVKGCV